MGLRLPSRQTLGALHTGCWTAASAYFLERFFHQMFEIEAHYGRRGGHGFQFFAVAAVVLVVLAGAQIRSVTVRPSSACSIYIVGAAVVALLISSPFHGLSFVESQFMGATGAVLCLLISALFLVIAPRIEDVLRRKLIFAYPFAADVMIHLLACGAFWVSWSLGRSMRLAAVIRPHEALDLARWAMLAVAFLAGAFVAARKGKPDVRETETG